MNGTLISFKALRLLLGSLLLAAVVLKLIDLSAYPAESDTIRRVTFAGVIEAELALAAWLCWGRWPRALWIATTVAFVGFAGVSLVSALQGNQSCGCFGILNVNPWATFALDVIVVLALVCVHPEISNATPAHNSSSLVVVSLYLVLALTAGLLALRAPVTAFDSAGNLIGDAQFVILEPERWIGSQLPLFPYMEIESDLHHGHWLVVIYHHACPTCIARLPEYEAMQAERNAALTGPQIALVELPPYADSSDAAVAGIELCVQGRLSPNREWFVQTPAEIELLNGVVVAARQAVHQ